VHGVVTPGAVKRLFDPPGIRNIRFSLQNANLLFVSFLALHDRLHVMRLS